MTYAKETVHVNDSTKKSDMFVVDERMRVAVCTAAGTEELDAGH